MIERRLIIMIGISLMAAGCSRFGKTRLPVVQLVLEIVAAPADRDAAMDQTIKTIQSRLYALGDVAEVKLHSAPADGRIVVFDQGEITGRFTKQSADDLALVLKSGSLPYPVKIGGESFFREK